MRFAIDASPRTRTAWPAKERSETRHLVSYRSKTRSTDGRGQRRSAERRHGAKLSRSTRVVPPAIFFGNTRDARLRSADCGVRNGRTDGNGFSRSVRGEQEVPGTVGGDCTDAGGMDYRAMTTGYLINRAAGRARTRCAPCLQAYGGQGTARPTICEMSCKMKIKIRIKREWHFGLETGRRLGDDGFLTRE